MAPSIDEDQNENGEIGDGGILKALKDLEWDVAEILAEKVILQSF